jgi:hypothetical protein
MSPGSNLCRAASVLVAAVLGVALATATGGPTLAASPV